MILNASKLTISDTLYQELKGCANRILASQAGNITLQTTEVVNEACLRLIEANGEYQSKEHLYRCAAKAMRHLLIDYARAKSTAKRGGDVMKTQWLDELIAEEDKSIGLIVVEKCVQQLANINERLETIIELHYFSGLSQSKIAEILSLSLRTVERELTFARAFLHDQLELAS